MYSTNENIQIKKLFEMERNKQVVVNPPFQRRSIWNYEIKSFFLESIIKKLPTPKIFFQERIENGIIYYDVVDGQQRLRCIFDFLRNDLDIYAKYVKDKSIMPMGKKICKYKDFLNNYKEDILNYQFNIEILHEAKEAEVLDMFERLNVHTIILKKQELRNAIFKGEFKKIIYEQSKKIEKFMLILKVMTNGKLLRMDLEELVSEIYIGMIDGLQDKKDSIDSYYNMYDKEFPSSNNLIKKFNHIMSIIKENYISIIPNTKFERKALFYSLFFVLYDIEFGLKHFNGPYKISNYLDTKKILLDINKDITSNINDANVALFIKASDRQTDNIKPRILRHNYILNKYLYYIR